jgi:predicted  nucleic acid-binding Zn-ribbon protein
MSKTLTLHRLQQTDSQTDKARARLQTILKTLEDDADLRKAKEQAKITASGLEAAQRLLRQAEAAVSDQRSKIEQAEFSLYSGNVRNPKELQDLQNDVESLKRYHAMLEDRQIEAMQTLKAAESSNQAAHADLQTVTIRLLQQNQSLAGERDQLLKDVENLDAERQAIVAAIPSDLLIHYEALRQQRSGVAVSSIAENSCSACGSSLTPSRAQSARLSNELVYCPTCGRILYGG